MFERTRMFAWVVAFAAMGCLAGTANAGKEGKGDKKEKTVVEGKVGVELTEEGEIESAYILPKGEDGEEKDAPFYWVDLKKGKGKELAEKMGGKQVKATGTVSTKKVDEETEYWLVVEKYEAVKEEAAEDGGEEAW